jgi:hypothetical protein
MDLRPGRLNLPCDYYFGVPVRRLWRRISELGLLHNKLKQILDKGWDD